MNSGLGEETAMNILLSHDRLSGTSLAALAKAGKPQLCQSCHADQALAAKGKPDVVNFSAAMHGWHANYMPFSDARSCSLCHPTSTTGSTRSLRDLHASLEVGCIECHGTMGADAVALLKGEESKPAARRLLEPLPVAGKDGIMPRSPWSGLPDCLNCHKDFQKPESGATGFNVWTASADDLYRRRADMAGVRCPACHGSTHALYPSRNPFDRDRDNMQPLQYSGSRAPIGTDRACDICHRKPMTDAIHHANMERVFRNPELLK